MTSSKPASKSGAHRQVPAPPDSRAAQGVYSRFIPREEIQGFANWTPESFGAAVSAAIEKVSKPGVTPPAARPAAPELSPAERAVQREQAIRAEVNAARQSGYADGYRDALVALDNFKLSHTRQMSAQIGQLLASFDAELAALEQQLADAVASVATKLARQVVRSELSLRPELVASVAREAVSAVLPSARHISLRVHPDDLALVAQGAGEVLAERGARLSSDDSLARGGCQVDSDVGSVDARIEARWQQATQALATDLPWDDPQ